MRLCVVRNADIVSLQTRCCGRDDLRRQLASSRATSISSGLGRRLLQQLRDQDRRSGGYNVQARNPQALRHVFVDSRLPAIPVSLEQCGPHRRQRLSGQPGRVHQLSDGQPRLAGRVAGHGGTDFSTLPSANTQRRDPTGQSIDVSQRIAGTQLSAAQATMMRDPAVVLAGWRPPI